MEQIVFFLLGSGVVSRVSITFSFVDACLCDHVLVCYIMLQVRPTSQKGLRVR